MAVREMLSAPDPEKEEEDGDDRTIDEGIPGLRSASSPFQGDEEEKAPPPPLAQPSPPQPRKPEEEDRGPG